MSKSKSKFIFVTGGVMSSVGKGVVASSLGTILQDKGFKVTNIKCEMYLNVDAGTIRPTEHGEVFVCDDGIETDQDVGNYERFTGNVLSKDNFLTYGQIYQELIRKERNLEFEGEDVEIVPDVPNEIIRRIKLAANKSNSDFTIVEFGGTVGEYQVLLFLEAARMMKIESPEDVLFFLVSYLPIPSHVGEMKTKPTQYASRTLNGAGIQEDFIIGRGPQALDDKRKEKLATFCNIKKEDVISAPDVDSIYDVPSNFEKENLSKKILNKFSLKPKNKGGLKKWEMLSKKVKNLDKTVEIGVVGKYFTTGEYMLSDSYISVLEAIKHAGIKNGVKPKMTWVDSVQFEKNSKSVKELSKYDGIVVPGGFGERGIEGIIKAIKYVRENKIPYLGLCYGMQLAVIEFARNVAGIKNATTAEINPRSNYTVVDIMEDQKEKMERSDYGGTMRLGAYPAVLKNGTAAKKIYGKSKISERHRHRFEINPKYIKSIEKAGMVFSGISPDKRLMEIMELPSNMHPSFMGSQFHPEFQSNPHKPHPLFDYFIKNVSA